MPSTINPRVRGERLANFPLSERWSIPAYAEKTRITSPTRSPQFDQTPHTRGRVSLRAIFPGPRPINPRMRAGKNIESEFLIRISIMAINPHMREENGPLRQDPQGSINPRIRGETIKTPSVRSAMHDQPPPINPHMRGENVHVSNEKRRSTPRTRGGALIRLEAHSTINPHVRGENGPLRHNPQGPINPYIRGENAAKRHTCDNR